MNETPETDLSNIPHPFASETTGDEQRFGAIDIVQAFTSLRHELKLQVRGGRELQEATVGGLDRIEQALLGLQRTLASATPATEGDAEARRMAESIAEIEESLQRAVAAIQQTAEVDRTPLAPPVLAVLRDRHAALPRLTRWLLGSWFQHTCDEIEQTLRGADSQEHWLSAAEGTGLLLARVHRLMAQCDLQRLDVVGLPFDPESMNAIELVQSGRCPSGYIAEQLRPAYRWRNAVLKTAEVRVEK